MVQNEEHVCKMHEGPDTESGKHLGLDTESTNVFGYAFPSSWSVLVSVIRNMGLVFHKKILKI